MMMIDRYREYGQWYAETRRLIECRYGADAGLFGDLLAATSPRKRVAENWRLAERIYREYKLTGRYSMHGLMPCHKRNVENALHGRPLFGPKVAAFAANLRGNLDRVTIDVWVCRYYGRERVTVKEYRELEKRIRREAKRYHLKPAEYQAIIWTIARSRYGYKPVSFAGIAAQGYLFDA